MLSTEWFKQCKLKLSHLFPFCSTEQNPTGLKCNISHAWHWWVLDKAQPKQTVCMQMGMMHSFFHICIPSHRSMKSNGNVISFHAYLHILVDCAVSGGGGWWCWGKERLQETTIAVIILVHLQGHQRSINTTYFTQGLQNHFCSCDCKILLPSLSHLRKVSSSGGSYRKE